MEKGFLFGAVLAIAASTATVIACSSDNSGDSTFVKPDAPDGGTIDNPLLPDGGGEAGEAGGGPQCETPTIPTDFKATWKAPTRAPTACTTEDLQGYYDGCLKDVNAVDACATYRTAHATCTSCVESPADSSGPIQWRKIRDDARAYYTLNIAGCIAVQQAPDGQDEAGCGAKYNAAIQCKRDSCTQCLETGGTFGNYTYCQSLVATQGVCASLSSDYGTSCQGTSSTAPTNECFQKSSGAEDASTYLVRVMGLTCGPAADAGQ